MQILALGYAALVIVGGWLLWRGLRRRGTPDAGCAVLVLPVAGGLVFVLLGTLGLISVVIRG